MRFPIPSAFAIAVLFAGFAPHGASADGIVDDRRAARAACVDDVKSLCADVTSGGGRIMQCIRSHEDKVSAPCHAAMEKLRADRKSAS